MGTYMETLVTSDPVFRGKGCVLSHFSANPNIDLWIDFVRNWSIDPKERMIRAPTTLKTSTDPMSTTVIALVTSDQVVRCWGYVQSHFSANPTIDFWIDFVQKRSIDP